MSIPTKDQAASRRRGLLYGNESPKARSSSLSLVSNVTGASNNSRGSIATITHDTHVKAKSHSERKKKSRKRMDHDQKAEPSGNDNTEDMKDNDVFTFMVGKEKHEDTARPEMQMRKLSSISQPKPAVTSQDEEHSQLQIEMALEPSSPPPNDETVPHCEAEDMEQYYRTQLSDSGISLGSSMSESHFEPIIKHILPPLIEEAPSLSPRVEYSTYAPSVADSHFFQHEQQHWTPYAPTIYTPEPMPLSPAIMRSYPIPHEYAYHGTPEPPSTGESSVACLESTPLVFRDKGSKTTAQPQIFRSFSKINQRMLLQMQSNIADLEQELALLDTKIFPIDTTTKQRKSDHGHSSKQLARDQSRRADLYQDLHASLEQYYESLSTYHRINQITYSCKPDEPAKLKSWLMNHVSPLNKIAPLVGDGSDLMHLGHAPSELPEEAYQMIVYNIVTNIFFPLLLFKFTSSMLTRLILLSLTTTAAILVTDRYHAQSKQVLGNVHWHCIIGSVGVSLLAALLF